MDNNRYIIKENSTLKEALELLNEHSSDILVLFVLNSNDQLVGSLTDGDIRRGLINGYKLDDFISEIMFKGFSFAKKDNIDEKINSINIQHIKLLPVVDFEGKLIEIINLSTYKQKLPIDAFIMAGGEGRRLRPLTESTPKPLLIVGDKPIMEHNIDKLKSFGIDQIYVSINYLGDQIKSYFGNGDRKRMKISYIEEKSPLGTIGSISLVNEFENEIILLMNSDLLTDINLAEMYHSFIKQDADFMVATIPYKVTIPYAVMETKEDKITSFAEKPTYTYQSNAGIYLFKKEFVDFIPKNKFFNATDLIEKMIVKNKQVCYFPIFGYWLDIGQHEDFEKAKEDINHLEL